MTDAQQDTTTEKKAKAAPAPSAKAKLSRKTLREIYRKKLKERIQKDVEWAKAFFDGKSKRSAARKVAFRKRHAKSG